MTDDAQRFHTFINNCRKMYNVDRDMVPWEMTDKEWESFRQNPFHTLIRLDDERAHLLLEAANI